MQLHALLPTLLLHWDSQIHSQINLWALKHRFSIKFSRPYRQRCTAETVYCLDLFSERGGYLWNRKWMKDWVMPHHGAQCCAEGHLQLPKPRWLFPNSIGAWDGRCRSSEEGLTAWVEHRIDVAALFLVLELNSWCTVQAQLRWLQRHEAWAGMQTAGAVLHGRVSKLTKGQTSSVDTRIHLYVMTLTLFC